MSSEIINSRLLADEKKVDLTEHDLFDRIINLKLYAGERKPDGTCIIKDTYVVRSDWEIYYPKQYDTLAKGSLVFGNTGRIRKCKMKPSIKVQYKQISTGVAIEMDIFVSNFFMLDSTGQMLMSFNNIGYPILKVEVQMGYWGQFKRAPANWEEYSNLQYQNGAEVITCNVNYSQTDKLPPDSTLHIHGYVGNCYGAPVHYDGQPLSVNFSDLENAYKRDMTVSLIEDYCFQNVTRRFLRTTIFESDKHPTLFVDDSDKKIGRMDKESAKKYGIRVYCTKALREASDEAEKAGALKTSDGQKVDIFTAGLNSRSAVEVMNSIRGVLGLDCTFQALKDGNYIALLTSELKDMDKLAESVGSAISEGATEEEIKIIKALQRNWHSQLPAVYNITTDAICTILCPFFYFVDPFNVLEFKSRYALGGIVSYYANFNASEETFYVLWLSVSFATVDDINECQIACTGSQTRRTA